MDESFDLYQIVQVMRLKNETANFSFRDKDIHSEGVLMWAMGKRGILDSNEITMSYSEILKTAGLPNSVRLFEVEKFIESFIAKAKTDIIEYKGRDATGEPVTVTTLLFSQFINRPMSETVTFVLNEKMKDLYQFDSGYYTLSSKAYYEKGTPYSKRLLVQLSKQKYLGVANFTPEELKYLLGAPYSYSPGKMKTRILDKAVEELTEDFPGLIMTETRKRQKIINFSFTWDVAAQYDRKKAEITDRGTKSLDGVKLAEPAESTQFTRPTKLTQSAKSTQSLDERIDRYIELNHEKLNVAPHFDWKSARYATPDEIRAAFSENRLISFIERRVAESGLPADPHLWMSKFTEEEIESMLRNQL